MKLKSGSLRGLTGVHRGLGVEQVDLNLDNLVGVIGLVGPNGAGKTTILECLQPFRVLPSRNITLKDAVMLRDSWKDLTYEMNGRTIREFVTVDAVSGKSEGYLWVDGEPKTTGKITELDEELKKLFGTSELFFHSAFSAQGAKSLLSLKASERKEFFVEFLRLEQYQEYSDRAKAVAAWVTGAIEGQRGSVDRLKREVAEWERIMSELTKAMQLQDNLAAQWRPGDERMAQLKERVRECEARAQEQQRIADRAAVLRRRIDELKSDFESAAKKASADQRNQQDAVDAGKRQIFAWKTERQKLSAVQPASMDAGRPQRISRLESQLVEIQQKARRKAAIEAAMRAVDLKYRQETDGLRTAQATGSKLAALTEKIPQKADREICGSCGFAQAALKAEAEQGEIEKALAAALDRSEVETAQLREQLKEFSGSDGDEDRIRKSLEMERRAEQEERRAVTADQSRVQRLVAIDASVAERENQIRQAELRVKEIGEHLSVISGAHERRMQEAAGELSKLVVDATASQSLRQALDEVGALERKLRQLRDDIESAKVSIGVLQQRRDRCSQARADLDRLHADMATADEERADWAFLQQICGKDKLQALELDVAAPEITMIANELLADCFGGRFGIQFETLNEKGQEVFDMIVTDMESGTQETLSLKSGGQKVVVLQALRLAITIYAKDQSGRDYRTLFMDECDGALDPEARAGFVDMLKAAMRRGGFETVFLITHSVEVMDRVDKLLVFADGQVRLEEAGYRPSFVV